MNEKEERRRKVVALNNDILARIGAAKALFLAEGCEDDHEGSGFDCWVLDQFDSLATVVTKKFNMKQFRKKA